MSEPFKNYIKAIGKGLNAGRSLDQQEAFDAMSQVLSGKVGAEQLGAFLMLLRVREETVEELAGFLAASRAHCKPELSQLAPVDLDLGCYAGKRRHLPWFLLAVKALAGAGYTIFMHGTAEPESKRLYMRTVFEHFGWSIAENAAEAEQDLTARGFCYMDLADINQPLDKLIQLRSEFGLRSCANSLARMLNPTRAKASFHGVFHRGFDSRHIEVAKLLNDPNVSCIRGEGGEVEVNPEREFQLHIGRTQQQSCIHMPAFLTQWQTKPRELEIEQLKLFWQGELNTNYAEYGQSAVSATLTAMLILMQDLPADVAQQQAEQIWLKRDLNW